MERAGGALAAVEDDDARGVDAARGDKVVARVLCALLARDVAPAAAAVADDVALRAGAVLQLDGEMSSRAFSSSRGTSPISSNFVGLGGAGTAAWHCARHSRL